MTQRLYVPEIGAKLTLAQDWTFSLYHETRNEDVFQAPGLERPANIERIILALNTVDQGIADLRQRVATRRGLTPTQMRYEWVDPRTSTPEEVAANEALHAERREWIVQFRALSVYPNLISFPVVLPRGTILTVDRIYIRKGVSEYSSLTFLIHYTPLPALTHVTQGGTLPKGTKRRFWAKLHDVNAMMVEESVAN